MSGAALADERAAFPSASPELVRQAVDRGVGYLRVESAAWLSQRTCAACHHAGMPLWAMAEAGRMGYAVDRKYLADTIEATLGGPEKLIAVRLVAGPNDPPDTQGTMIAGAQTRYLGSSRRSSSGRFERSLRMAATAPSSRARVICMALLSAPAAPAVHRRRPI
jgi:hypothetical protein